MIKIDLIPTHEPRIIAVSCHIDGVDINFMIEKHNIEELEYTLTDIIHQLQTQRRNLKNED